MIEFYRVEEEEMLFEPAFETYGSSEPAVRFTERKVRVQCLKCGWKNETCEFSFVCPFCRSSNFGIGECGEFKEILSN